MLFPFRSLRKVVEVIHEWVVRVRFKLCMLMPRKTQAQFHFVKLSFCAATGLVQCSGLFSSANPCLPNYFPPQEVCKDARTSQLACARLSLLDGLSSFEGLDIEDKSWPTS